MLPVIDGETHSSGQRSGLAHQEPRARASHSDIHQLSVQITVVVEVEQCVAPCPSGPSTLGSSFDKYFVGLSKSPGVIFRLNTFLELFELAVTPMLLSERDVVLPAS